MNESKVLRIQGLSSSMSLVKDDPYAAVNRRISLVVLNQSTQRRIENENAAAADVSAKDAREVGTAVEAAQAAAQATTATKTRRDGEQPVRGRGSIAMAATILVADDSATMRMIVQATLAGAGWTVLTAGNGQEALEMAKRHPVDLVVSDWNMPVMGGLELIQGLRQEDQYLDVPVLVLTTEDDVDSKMAAPGSGCLRLAFQAGRPRCAGGIGV
jgi:two-component system chemotaxis response regulator CheY